MGAKTYTLTREQVAELCPECAEKMKLQRVSALKLRVVDPGGEDEPELKFFRSDDTEVKVYAGFSQGLCKRFGADERFFARCVETMAGKEGIDDEKSFCASLHKFCIGEWPGEKKHTQQDYVIREEDGKFCLYDSTGKKKLGEHDTKDKAIAQERAIQAAKQAAEQDADVRAYSNVIKGVEIFSTGTHNGDEYTTQDLDQMIAASKELDYRPAIKVGHSKDTPGAPAYGWVRNLRRVGEKLYADFEDMHDTVIDAIRKRNYDRVSSEIYFGLKRGGKTFAKALKAVALLGAEVPAVAGLTPLHKMEFVESGFDTVAAFETELEVPTETLLATMAERVAGLVNLMKESDMAKNAEKIAALTSQVAEFKDKMAEMMKKKGKMKPEDMEDDEEYKQLSAQAQDISDRIAELDSDDTADAETLRADLTQTQEDLAAAQAREKELATRVAVLEQAGRMKIIGERVAACKVPAFRTGLEALYSYALEHPETTVKVYAKDDKGQVKTEDKTLGDIVDGFVMGINAQAEKLFKAMAFSTPLNREDSSTDGDPSAEINKRTKAYQVAHPDVKSYETAMRAVLSADEELAARYRAQLEGSGQAQ